jgi:hypothetical protein
MRNSVMPPHPGTHCYSNTPSVHVKHTGHPPLP